jgi:ATP-dependent DNA helicase RecG
MEAMMHLELTFCGYEGTRRMRKAMHQADLPEPRFRQIEAHAHQVHVTLENNIIARKSSAPRDVLNHMPEAEFIALSQDERAIVNFLASGKEINITHASFVTGRSWPTARKIMSELVDKGYIEQSSKRGRKHDATKTYRFKSLE